MLEILFIIFAVCKNTEDLFFFATCGTIIQREVRIESQIPLQRKSPAQTESLHCHKLTIASSPYSPTPTSNVYIGWGGQWADTT